MIIENDIVENITLIPENDKLANVSIDYGLFSNIGFWGTLDVTRPNGDTIDISLNS